MGETKQMIKLKDILMERISDVVYHFTTMKGATNIIETNRFRLNPVPVDTNVDPGKKYREGYYMSLTRTKSEAYTKWLSTSECFFVRLELDGGKLSNTMKGGAYNFWKDQHGKDDYEEYEDRLYSMDMYVPNAVSYIKRLDLDVSRQCKTGFKFETLIKTATGAGIPTFLFPSREKWSQQSGGIEVKDLDGYKLFMQSLVK